mgnify:CR=1 FL=1
MGIGGGFEVVGREGGFIREAVGLGTMWVGVV